MSIDVSREPRRIRLSRRKGFRLQKASRKLNGLPAVKVDRSTKWGNPFAVGKRCRRFGLDVTPSTIAECVDLYRLHFWEVVRGLDLRELSGKNLACWCRGARCHAVPLLYRANTLSQENKWRQSEK